MFANVLIALFGYVPIIFGLVGGSIYLIEDIIKTIKNIKQKKQNKN